MDSHWRHKTGITWSAVTDSFASGGISESVYFIWKYELDLGLGLKSQVFSTKDQLDGYPRE